MTAKELDLARAQNAMLELTAERLHRLERAVAELAEETHGVSTPAQLVARGKPFLASLVEDFRSRELTYE